MSKEIATGIAIVILSILFFSFKAGDISSQFTGDENFYYQSSRNMLETGDWLTPRYYNKPRFQKPILYYWLVALSFKGFGISWFAARFPSILLAALTVLLVYLMAFKIFKSKPLSLISAAVLATTFKFFKYSRFTIPDMTLIFFITLSFYIFMKLLEEERRSLWMIFFFSLSLATLTKGPVGVIIPVLSIASFSLFSRARITIRKSDIISGVLLYILVILPWVLMMLKLHGTTFVSQVWIREITHRVAYHSDTKEGISVFVEYLKSLPFYIPIVILRFLPWTLFLPIGISKSFSIAKSDSEAKSFHILLLSWFFVVFIFFTILGEKHSQYMLALTPPFALIIGGSFSRALESKRLRVPIILSLVTSLTFFSFLSNKEFRLNNAILGGFASEILSYGLDEDDSISVGSHGLIPQKLEVYLDRTVEKIGGKWHEPSYHEDTNKKQIESFFKRSNGAYCIIRKEDYSRYISPNRKKRLKIIYKDTLWKRKIEITKDRLTLLSRGNINLFLDGFKEEYYLVTDK